MLHEDCKAFLAATAHKRLLGLDIGTKTIGLALSDAMHLIATPLETVQRTKFTKDAEVIFGIIETHDIAGLVLGLPLNMNGSEGPKCQSVRQFGRNLLKQQEFALYFQDERLSTVAVRHTLEEADFSHDKRAKLVDSMAASFILQGVLDSA